jgi:NAD(P)-dependent dehydrogenase (short-subunit alcohol dehydrogenase family)
MKELSGSRAIITGGGTGIGRGIARNLAMLGVKVVLCGRRDQPLDEVVREIVRAGGQALGVQADISQEKDVARVVASAMDVFGGVDILVNNAGIGGGEAIHDHSIEEWDQIMAVNLRGPFLLCRAVLPFMRSKRNGHIINISSESGMEYYPQDGAYGVSKHALNALGEYIQRENQDFGIRLDTICPGMVVTEMTESNIGLDHTKCLYPEDIADLVIWLLTRRENIKIGRPVLIQTMKNPWE